MQVGRISEEAFARRDALHPTASWMANDDIRPIRVRAAASVPPQTLAPPAPPTVARQTSPIMAVLLVLLAATITGTVVYFAL